MTSNSNKGSIITAILVSLLFFTSLLHSRQFLNPLWAPKFYWFFFISSLLLIVYFTGRILADKPLKIGINLPSLFLVLYIVYISVQLFVQGNWSLQNQKYMGLLFCVFMYFLIKDVFRSGITHKALQILIFGYLGVGLLQSVYAIFQLTGLASNLLNLYSFGGAFGNPNILATYLISILPFALAVYLFYSVENRTDKYIKAIALLVLAVGLLLVVISKSRSAWLGGFIGVCIVLQYRFNLLIHFRRLVKPLFSKIIIGLFGVGIVYFLSIALINFKPDSAHGRAFIWENTLQVVLENPVFGVGYGKFPVEYNNYQSDYFAANPNDSNAWYSACIDTAFNEFLEVLCETGIFGFLCFTGFIVSLLWRRKFGNDTDKFIFTAAIGSFMAIVINSTLSYTIYILPVYFNFVFLAAILSAIPERKVIWLISVPKTLLPKIFIPAIFVVFITSAFVYQSYRKEKPLSGAVQLLKKGQPGKAEKICVIAYPNIKRNNDFILLYAQCLLINGHFARAIELLEQSKQYCHSNKLYMLLGDSYLGIGDYKQAVENYLHSHNQVPNLFTPMYSLFRLYKKQGKFSDAYYWAQKIKNMKEKVPSPRVREIKDQMTLFIGAYKKDN